MSRSPLGLLQDVGSLIAARKAWRGGDSFQHQIWQCDRTSGGSLLDNVEEN